MKLEAQVTSSDGEVVSQDVEITVGGTGVSIPDTIPADGSDQSAALQAFFDQAGDGVDIYVPKLYRFDWAGPKFQHRRNVRLHGPGGFTTPTDGYDVPPTPGHQHGWPRTRNRLTLIGCDDFTVEGIILEGSNQTNMELRGYVEALEGQHGIDANGCLRLRVLGVTIRFVRGDWLYLGGGLRYDGTKGWSESVLFKGNHLSYNGRQGFGITGVRDALIEENDTTHCRRTLIDFEANGPNGGGVDVTFRNNAFGPSHLTFLTIHRTGILERISMLDCTAFQANVLTPLNDAARIKDLRIERLRSTQSVGNPQGAAWRLSGIDGLVVKDNHVKASGNRDMHLMSLIDCTGVDASPEEQAFTMGEPPVALPLIRPESWYFDIDGVEHGTKPVVEPVP